jgi:ferrochelatase
MPRYAIEPPFRHGTAGKTAILLVNLGSPESATPAAVRRYLKQFLSDPRVVDIPRALWLPLLHGIILNTRPRASARKYARIWSNEGAPLAAHTRKQAALLGDALRRRIGSPFCVDHAMRYGEPSIGTVLARLKAAGCDRILVLPLYPQYAASTTASVFDEVAGFLQRTRNVPEVRMVKHFHDHPAYIAALGASVREHWQAAGSPGRLLMSFHGLPRALLDRGDPYHCECQKTARLLAEHLQLAAHPDQWRLTFQSRFGRAQWLQPYTAATLADLGRQGLSRVDIICPGFVADCLETLEEIGIEARETFLAAGGKEFNLIPCLNERSDWIEALAGIALEHLSGWVSESRDARAARSTAEQSRRDALALGAKD